MGTLADIGERKAIALVERTIARSGSAGLLGDDCAALPLGQEYLLVTTDMVGRHTHMPPSMTPYQIGWTVVAVNLSDIAAKGGRPLGVVIAYGLPKTTTEHFLTELTRGAAACANHYGTTIVGGDTKETSEVALTGTALGLVKKALFMPRKGARPGEIVAVTGTLGKAAAGFLALQQGMTSSKVTKALLEPQPRLKEGQRLASSRAVTSSMDLSDGLSSSLYQLSSLNHVGFTIEWDRLPIAPELRMVKKRRGARDEEAAVLHFGGDYELLVTMQEAAFPAVQRRLRRLGTALTVIGTVTKRKDVRCTGGPSPGIVPNKGFEHFSGHVLG